MKTNINTDHILINTKQLINDKIKIKQNQQLCTVDITALYPNIDRIHLIQTLKNLEPPIPDLIIDLIIVCLKLNYINFQATLFRQIKGIPMGISFAVNLANLYLHIHLDTLILKQLEPSPGNLIDYYKRFIDDIFIITRYHATHSCGGDNIISEIEDILTPTNLKITKIIEQESINFLDAGSSKTGMASQSFEFVTDPSGANVYLDGQLLIVKTHRIAWLTGHN